MDFSQYSDMLVVLGQVLLIDIVLAGDNAIVVGMAAAGLPADQRRKAIFWGIAAATIMRIGFASITVQLLSIVGIVFAGGVLLLWVCWKMYRELRNGGGHGEHGAGEDGAELRDRLIAVRETQFGDDHAHTAHALALFGGVRLAAGDAESAANFTRRALDLQSDALPDDHPDLGATLLILAESLRAVGQMDEAGPHFTRALTIWERSAGADHPVTLETVRGLARTALGSGDSAAALPHLERLRAAATGKGSEAGALPEHTESLPHLRLLVTLAGILAEEGERDRSRQIVVESLALSCWQPAPYAEADVFETLAVSMAEIARVFKALEEPESSTEAIRRARGYATRVPSPKELLARVDAMLERETAVGSDL